MTAVTNIPISATTTDFVAAVNAAKAAVGSFDKDLNSKLITSFRGLDRVQKEYAQGLGRVQKELAKQKELARQAAEAAKGQSLFDKIGNIVGLAGGLASVGAAFAAIKQGLQITSDFQRLDQAIKAVSTSNADYARSMALLRSLSDSLGFSFEALTEAYKGIKAASNGTVLEGKATEQIFTSIVHAGAALKLSSDEVKGTLLAVQQMMSKGAVQAEELRGQLGERLPGAFRLMAQALGVTEPQLNKMLEQGQVLATDALPKLAAELEKVYGKQAQNNINSMAGGWTRLTDQTKQFISEFSKTSGLDTFFTKLGNYLANYVQGLREAQRRGESVFMLSGDRRQQLTSQAQERQKFAASNATERGEMLKALSVRADDYRNKIANPGNFTTINGSKVSEGAVVSVNRKLLADVEERIMLLRRDNLKLLVAERQESDKAAKLAVTGPARLDIDKLRKDQSALSTQIANGKLNGDNVDALQAKYDALTKQIDRATESTKKHKESFNYEKPLTELQKVEHDLKLLYELQQDNLAYGIRLSAERRHEIELLEAKRRQIKGESEKDPSLKATGTNPFSQIMQGNQDRRDTFMSALSQSPALSPIITQVQEATNQIVAAYTQMRQSIKSAAQDTAVEMSEGLGSVLVGIATGQTSLLSGVLGLITDFLSSYLSKIAQAKIIAGAALIAASIFPPDPYGLAQGAKMIQSGGLLKVAAGAVKVIGGGLSSLKAFAKGGVFDRPSVGLFGEYAGATRNREIATPERLMASTFRKELNDAGFEQVRNNRNQTGAMAPIPLEISVNSTLRGSDIHLSQKRFVTLYPDYNVG